MAFTPAPGSPVALGAHPRFHFTSASIADLRAKLSSLTMVGSETYKQAYQYYIDYYTGTTLWNMTYATQLTQGHGLLGPFWALIYALGDGGAFDGNFSYAEGRGPSECGAKALEQFSYFLTQPIPTTIPGGASTRTRTDRMTAMALTYDWIYPLLSTAQKEAWTDLIITYESEDQLGIRYTGDNDYIIPSTIAPTRLWSSPRETGDFHWTLGISVKGDGYREVELERIVNSWENCQLTGHWLDCENFISRKSTLLPKDVTFGQDNPGHYGRWSVAPHWFMDYHRVSTAMGVEVANIENSLDPGSGSFHIPNLVTQFIYQAMPANPIAAIPFAQEEYPGYGFTGSPMSYTIRLLSANLIYSSLSQEAGLLQWFLEQMGQTGRSTQRELKGWITCHDGRTTPISAEDYGLPKVVHTYQQGLYIRSSFGYDPTATLIIAVANEYWLNGHGYGGGMTPIGLYLVKNGLLIGQKVLGRTSTVRYRFCSIRVSDYDPPHASNTIYGGFRTVGPDEPINLSFYTPESTYYAEGFRRIYENEAERIVSATAVKTRWYDPAYLSRYTRDYCIFHASESSKPDYIVMMDKVQVPDANKVVRCEFTSAYQPATDDPAGWSVTAPGHYLSTGSSIITVDNRNGGAADPTKVSMTPATDLNIQANGKAFVKTLLPVSHKVIMVGGLNYEGEQDDGTLPAGTTGDRSHLNSYGTYYCLGHYFDIIPVGAPSTDHIFLNVIQAAKADTTSAMCSTSLVSGTSGYSGALIEDEDRFLVVMFSSAHSFESETAVSYTINAGPSVDVQHLIHDLDTTKSYTIKQGDIFLSTGAPTTNGVLFFETVSGGLISVYADGDNPEYPEPPGPEKKVFMLGVT